MQKSEGLKPCGEIVSLCVGGRGVQAGPAQDDAPEMDKSQLMVACPLQRRLERGTRGSFLVACGNKS